MARHPTLSGRVLELAESLELFEASESIGHTGTGSRREGEQFEHLIAELWKEFQLCAVSAGASASAVRCGPEEAHAKLSFAQRSLYVPHGNSIAAVSCTTQRWLERRFLISELVKAFPTENEAVQRYAPAAGPFSGELYPTMYSRLTTEFDDTVVLEDNGVLHEKILMEYKTAKSSKGRQIDGNAHERLSFQILQYLEVATRYPRCSLAVLGNGAFVRYRNKYHVSFRTQADRLRCFSWFSMEYLCTANEYTSFLSGLLAWLFGSPSRQSPCVP